MQDALRIRKNSGISRGTYHRIVAQGKKNIRESLFTVAVAIQLGFLRVEDVQKLLGTVSALPASIDSEKLPEILELVRVLADRIMTI